MSFSGRVIWLTGASSGIGKEVAILLSKQKAKLILSSRNKDNLEQVKSLCEHQKHIRILPLDLENYLELEEKSKTALTFFGTIDILINNGGVGQRAYAKDTIFDVDKRIMDTNYFGTLALSKAVLPHFLQHKKGQFVIISSLLGKFGTPLRSAYAASKHALHGFFDSLRAEIHDQNISVTIICPGYVKTEISRRALTGNGAPQNKMDNTTASGLDPVICAKKILKAVSAKKQEVYISKKEVIGVYLKRFFPSLFSYLIRKVKVV